MSWRPAVVSVLLVGLGSCAVGCTGETGASARSASVSLSDFVSGAWDLRVDRVWDRDRGHVGLPTDPLDESDYRPISDGPTYHVAVSPQGERVAIGQPPIGGRCTATADNRHTYDLSEGTFAGGRFVVWSGATGLQAELTIYGSGLPIVQSERGALVPRPAWLPIVQPVRSGGPAPVAIAHRFAEAAIERRGACAGHDHRCAVASGLAWKPDTCDNRSHHMARPVLLLPDGRRAVRGDMGHGGSATEVRRCEGSSS